MFFLFASKLKCTNSIDFIFRHGELLTSSISWLGKINRCALLHLLLRLVHLLLLGTLSLRQWSKWKSRERTFESAIQMQQYFTRKLMLKRRKRWQVTNGWLRIFIQRIPDDAPATLSSLREFCKSVLVDLESLKMWTFRPTRDDGALAKLIHSIQACPTIAEYLALQIMLDTTNNYHPEVAKELWRYVIHQLWKMNRKHKSGNFYAKMMTSQCMFLKSQNHHFTFTIASNYWTLPNQSLNWFVNQ